MIVAEKLCKNYGSFEALKDVSFRVEKGEIVGFLGSNAAGKTTTMRILTCYFPPTSGRANVAGFDVFNQSLEVRKNVGYLPENVPLYTDMPVNYFLDFAASLKGVPFKERKKKVESAIDRCGLTHVQDHEIGSLSKGYRQRVGIAQAIITDPPVLILDEPTVGLDPKQIVEIRNLITGFGGKSTVILSTHILHEIEKVCNRILIIDRGEILAFDTLDNLIEKMQKSFNLTITVEGATDKVKAVLKEIKEISKLQDAGKVDSGIYRYKMKIPTEFSLRREIAKTLNQNGFTLIEMTLEKMSAEDVFRKIVPDRKKISDDSSNEETSSDEKGGKQ